MQRYCIAIIFCAIFGAASCCDVVSLTFPSGFRIGTASASYQVEGAWNVSDKGESVWDRWSHEHPEHIADGRNADVACNSYYKYKEDVQWIKSLGLDFYRFSISWPRVLPTGFANVVSEDGLQYYKNLTEELVANGIEPIVTLYHWDHPQILEDMGGWTNELMVYHFRDYARVMYEALGNHVKRWITINEPDSFCDNGYTMVTFAPGKAIPDLIGKYLCGHNVLKAHALAYRLYDEEFRATQQGQISIVLPAMVYLSANSNDTTSEETAFQFTMGWMAHAIYHGDYPEILKTRVEMISKVQGYPRSRLPEFSKEWIDIINGTHDYFGFNHYTSRLVSPDPDEALGIYNSDMGLLSTFDPNWAVTTSPWFYVHPPGFGYILRKIKNEYGNPPIWVMENGYSSDAGELKDYKRISYYYEYLRELLIAVKRDGCRVEGYAIWSILDNYEWNAGYTQRFGIINVDFDDDQTARTVKSSTSWWASVLAMRKLQSVPSNTVTTRTSLPWSR